MARKLLFSLVLLAAVVATLELAGAVALRVLNGRWIAPAEVVGGSAAEAADAGAPGPRQAQGRPLTEHYMAQHVLHPYVGFVRNPDLRVHDILSRTIHLPVNDFGFFGDSPLRTRGPNDAHVFLLGGSLALDLVIDVKAYLENLLGRMPRFAGRDVHLIPLALGGMKQPQQAILLTYLLSLGAEVDMVIALDGFNEITLPLVENRESGVYPFFPRKWNVYGASSIDMEMAGQIGRIGIAREAVETSRAFIRTSWLRRSRLAAAAWQSIHRRTERALAAQEMVLRTLAERRDEGASAQLRGPAYPDRDDDAATRDCADVWYRSVLQQWALCRDRGIPFFQFLQPNQYVPGTKKLSAWERRNAVSPHWRYAIAATRGYPELKRRGARLAAEGVPYLDLGDVFLDVEETIYKDICCHVNAQGHRLIAERMADAIATRWGAELSPLAAADAGRCAPSPPGSLAALR